MIKKYFRVVKKKEEREREICDTITTLKSISRDVNSGMQIARLNY